MKQGLEPDPSGIIETVFHGCFTRLGRNHTNLTNSGKPISPDISLRSGTARKKSDYNEKIMQQCSKWVK
jgi:hypothetical protein